MSSSANSSRRGRIVVGVAVVQQLERLQDRMEPFPRTVAIATIEAAFGESLGRIFVSFGEPVAAASIAQVHRARVKDAEGERDVAVKVLRPGVERLFRRDLGDMYVAAVWPSAGAAMPPPKAHRGR